MNIKMLKATLAGLALSLSSLANATLITNGSLTGSIDNAGVPTGWSSVIGSPDTMDENNNVGGPYGSFQATPSASPDGGTWIGFAASGTFFEVFGQDVTGLTVGTYYDLSWYHGNFGYGGYNGANAIEVLLDNVVIGSGSILGLSTDWFNEMISFSATETNHRVDFRLQYDTQSYHSIDGISLTQSNVNAVPEPSTLAIFALGIMGLASRRFKKQ